jgi:hypothetical protein
MICTSSAPILQRLRQEEYGIFCNILEHKANHVPRSKDQNLSKILIYITEERKNIP